MNNHEIKNTDSNKDPFHFEAFKSTVEGILAILIFAITVVLLFTFINMYNVDCCPNDGSIVSIHKATVARGDGLVTGAIEEPIEAPILRDIETGEEIVKSEETSWIAAILAILSVIYPVLGCILMGLLVIIFALVAIRELIKTLERRISREKKKRKWWQKLIDWIITIIIIITIVLLIILIVLALLYMIFVCLL